MALGGTQKETVKEHPAVFLVQFLLVVDTCISQNQLVNVSDAMRCNSGLNMPRPSFTRTPCLVRNCTM